ncbi:MAG TPA: DUF3418 domain-containing protein, partial [Ilumatobacteraceae bacterium]|nr:DUF3418 domain-containing protein [Ilumatobacteraceae bacterium]
ALRSAGRILAVAADTAAKLDRLVTPPVQPSVTDARSHLAHLVRPGFVTAAGIDRLDDVLRYVRGVATRVAKIPEDPARDRRSIAEAVSVEAHAKALFDKVPPSRVTREMVELGWLTEELRVSLFAQTLGTSVPVSSKRIMRELDRLDRELA